MVSITSVKGMKTPISRKSFPLENPMGDASFGSYFEANSVTFSKWEDQCLYNSYAIKTNEFASDMSSINIFRNIIFDRVLDENVIFFDNPKESWIGDTCGGFPCSGPNNVLLKVLNFKEPTDLQDINKLETNSKWEIFS